jgi:hypothetical protein
MWLYALGLFKYSFILLYSRLLGVLNKAVTMILGDFAFFFCTFDV